MNARLRTLVLLVVALTTVFALAIGPAMATESAPAPAGGEESGKIEFPQTAHDRVGLIVLGITGVFALGALANAAKQLRGSRPQADGRIRWR